MGALAPHRQPADGGAPSPAPSPAPAPHRGVGGGAAPVSAAAAVPRGPGRLHSAVGGAVSAAAAAAAAARRGDGSAAPAQRRQQRPQPALEGTRAAALHPRCGQAQWGGWTRRGGGRRALLGDTETARQLVHPLQYISSTGRWRVACVLGGPCCTAAPWMLEACGMHWARKASRQTCSGAWGGRHSTARPEGEPANPALLRRVEQCVKLLLAQGTAPA